ncbi:hypothetical protein FB451DRAFT_1569692 [Mycena latifolia]|nr:hypothetical protein FB451DRAFT_1569692 [Mycena latifolia]
MFADPVLTVLMVLLQPGFNFLLSPPSSPSSVSVFPALNNRDEAQLSASLTPSRVSGTPSKALVVQEIPGFALGFFIFIVVSLSLAAGTHQWIRSPGSPGRRGCFRKESTPPPPPPPFPPQALHPGSDAQDRNPDRDEANGGGDDGPKQDGAADDEDFIRDGDGLAVGAAPAPEDPPPPAGDIEEVDDEDGIPSLSDSGISWLLLLLLGKIATALKRLTRVYR